jgi:hypothetical protein
LIYIVSIPYDVALQGAGVGEVTKRRNERKGFGKKVLKGKGSGIAELNLCRGVPRRPVTFGSGQRGDRIDLVTPSRFFPAP